MIILFYQVCANCFKITLSAFPDLIVWKMRVHVVIKTSLKYKGCYLMHRAGSRKKNHRICSKSPKNLYKISGEFLGAGSVQHQEDSRTLGTNEQISARRKRHHSAVKKKWNDCSLWTLCIEGAVPQRAEGHIPSKNLGTLSPRSEKLQKMLSDHISDPLCISQRFGRYLRQWMQAVVITKWIPKDKYALIA